MTFTNSEVLIIGVMLSGIISFLLMMAFYRHCIRHTMKLPSSSIPTKRKIIGSIVSSVVITALWFLLLIPTKMVSASAATLLVVTTILLVSFSFFQTRKYIKHNYALTRTDVSQDSVERRKSLYAIISVSVVTLLLPVITFMGTGNLLLYLLPDITTVRITDSGYTYSTDYGWPKEADTQMTKSYLRNLTHDTLYITKVLYAILGEDDYNDYSVSKPYPPGSTSQIARRPQYVMTGIPLIRDFGVSRSGRYRRFDSYLVDRDMLDKFKNAQMGIYSLFPNQERPLGKPSRSTVYDTDKIFSYQEKIDARLRKAGVFRRPETSHNDRVPLFPGGEDKMHQFIADNMRYPAFAEATGSEGTVVVGFTVMPDGKIADIKTVKSADPSLDNEATRIVEKMPRWIPGILNSRPARCRMTLPVTFRLASSH